MDSRLDDDEISDILGEIENDTDADDDGEEDPDSCWKRQP
jgi:hypothetical protein